MKAGITTFGRVLIGQQFKVIWGMDEQVLLHPNTLYEKCKPGLAEGGAYNATAMVVEQRVGVWVDESRAVLAFEPDRAIDWITGITAAA